ncbi:fucose 4-O-acetylase-like acetyltransferase [Paenibacillus sp. DS2015]|uniref:acyltransferase family protein n=1 Tax=Paenibacillus sp. DS2015 TaxID=3373917 RepID=UPI003D225A58
MDTTLIKRGETYFLNLRFLLIVTVFVSNAIEPLIHEMAGLHQLFLWIFTFHMPLFVLVTGYFSKSKLHGAVGRETLIQICMQYVIFQTLYSILDITIFHVGSINHSFFAPYLLLWFLVSHFFWRLLTLAMYRLTPIQQIIISLILGVMVGYLQLDGVWLSVSRTFVYLPFFLIGHHFNFEKFLHFFTFEKRVGAAFISIGIFIILGLWGTNLPEGWLYGSMTYMQLNSYGWSAGIFRITLYLLQFISAAAFLAWVPMYVSRITDLGRRTLYVFLLHGFIIRLAYSSGLYHYIQQPLEAVFLIGSAIILAILLAQPIVRRMAQSIIEPSIHWVSSLEHRAFNRTL